MNIKRAHGRQGEDMDRLFIPPVRGNGDCETCGGPCAVFGCRFCPACYQANENKERGLSIPISELASFQVCGCNRCKDAIQQEINHEH